MHARKRTFCRVLHHKAHSLGKALEVPLHLSEHIGLRGKCFELHRRAVKLLLERLALFLPRPAPELIPRDAVLSRLHAIVCLLQRFFALRFLLLGLDSACLVRL